jgi:hypothetical protein
MVAVASTNGKLAFLVRPCPSWRFTVTGKEIYLCHLCEGIVLEAAPDDPESACWNDGRNGYCQGTGQKYVVPTAEEFRRASEMARQLQRSGFLRKVFMRAWLEPWFADLLAEEMIANGDLPWPEGDPAAPAGVNDEGSASG